MTRVSQDSCTIDLHLGDLLQHIRHVIGDFHRYNPSTSTLTYHTPLPTTKAYCTQKSLSNDLMVGQRKYTPSSSRREIAFHSFPVSISYAFKTEAKRDSEDGCVEEKARSNTYRSTALSSTSVEM